MHCNFCQKQPPAVSFYVSCKTKCRTCIKAAVMARRDRKIDEIRQYDRDRSQLPHRVEARKKYSRTDKGRDATQRAHKKYNRTNPVRRAAQIAAGNAIRDGRLIRQPCFVCGDEKAQVHHASYTLPLTVTWLCEKHHKQLHNEHRQYFRELSAMRTFILRSEQEHRRLTEYLSNQWEPSAVSGNALSVEIKPFRTKRSKGQNARLHAMVSDVASQVSVDGNRFSVATWKEQFKRMFLPCDDMTLPDGEIISTPISTTKLNIEEFGDFMTQIEQYAISEFSVEFSER